MSDFLNFDKRKEEDKKRYRILVHIGFSLLFLVIILMTRDYIVKNPDSDIIGAILTIAGYTYGPLLGLFSFGIFSKRKLKEIYVPIVCIVSPLICYLISLNSVKFLNGYVFSHELLILNGILTFGGLYVVSIKEKNKIIADEYSIKR